MKIIHKLENFPPFEKLYLTIGNFDGIHIGHQSIMNQMKKEAKFTPRMVLTFERAPLLSLSPNHFLGYLTPSDYKIRWFENHGFDFYVNLNFDQVRNFSAGEFIAFLQERVQKLHLFLGDNFRFGKGNSGNVHSLTKQSVNFMDIRVIPRLKKGWRTVSSTEIRNLILAGKVDKAAKLLGRPFFIQSSQVKGDEIGTQIGFPTINTRINKQVIPQKGVYYTLLILPGIKKAFPAMSYVGKRPTVNGVDLRLETHVLEDFPETKCKNHLLLFVKKTRSEKKLKNLEDLSKILYNDRKLISALHVRNSFKNNIDQRLMEDFHALYQC